MVLSEGHILEPVWVGGTISSLTVDQSGVRNPRGPYRAWWSPPMDKCTTFSRQWFSKCTFDWGKLVIFASGQSFHNILPGVRTPQGLYEAWWDEPQQWTSLLLSLHSDFPNAFPGICGCVKVCSRYCTNWQGQFMHNKSGVLSPWGPCGAWWSRALVAGTLDKCTRIQIEWRDH